MGAQGVDTVDGRAGARRAVALRRRQRPRATAAYVLLTAGLVIVAFPFYWMVVSALKPSPEMFDLRLVPAHPTLDNFAQVLTRTQFPRWFGNSLIVAVILATLMIPTEMLVIPWYVMSSAYHWINTYWGIMFPGLMDAFGIFLIRQFASGLPDELFYAGRIDGVTECGLYWRIALPQIKPALAALCIFTFLGNWNAFLWPLIVIQTGSMRTLSVGIALFSGEAGSSWNLIMAASALAVLPVLAVFALLQRQIIEGITMTGLRG